MKTRQRIRQQLAGRKFGYWTVIEFAGVNEKNLQHRWLARCRCGFEQVRDGQAIKSAKTGCPACMAKNAGDINRTHGETDTTLHTAWCGMKKRCTAKPGARHHQDYVSRDINFFPPWKDYLEFRWYVLRYLGPHPGDGYSLDRIRNDEGYKPGNIRWATRSVQRANRRPQPKGYKKQKPRRTLGP